jgi:hypothetical protein
VLDFCVYAPIGFVLEARSLLPKFVDRGRNQIVLARVVGKYAVRRGTRATEGAIDQAQEQVRGVLRLVGAAPSDSAPSSNGDGTEADEPKRPLKIVESVPRPEPPFDPETLAIPDYDALSASQVVPRLESLTSEELEAVREYESGTRGRKTILTKIAQLQAS